MLQEFAREMASACEVFLESQILDEFRNNERVIGQTQQENEKPREAYHVISG